MELRHIRAKTETEGRVKNDYYPTPPFVGWSIIKQMRLLGINPHSVIEPCAGKGSLAKGMTQAGVLVEAFDLYEYPEPHYCDVAVGSDLLSHDYSEYDAVITNPPYAGKMPEKIIRKWAAAPSQTLGLFVRHTYVQAHGRAVGVFKELPPAWVIPYNRVNCAEEYFENPIGGFIDYTLMIWTKKNTETRMKWIDVKADYAEWSSVNGGVLKSLNGHHSITD